MIAVQHWTAVSPTAHSRFAALLLAYHRRTEAEKAFGPGTRPDPGHAGPAGREPSSMPPLAEPSDPLEQPSAEAGAGADLPARYRAEVDAPEIAFAHDDVLLALDGEAVVGCVVVTAGHDPEVKRLWVDPAARRRGVAALLLQASAETARARGARELRLSVWEWRSGAIALYRRSGYLPVPSWDPRPALVCLALPLD